MQLQLTGEHGDQLSILTDLTPNNTFLSSSSLCVCLSLFSLTPSPLLYMGTQSVPHFNLVPLSLSLDVIELELLFIID